MKYLFHLGHPAHFHLFKNVINRLQAKGHNCLILIKTKDILEDLLQKSNIEYLNILPQGRTDGKYGMLVGLIKTDYRLLLVALRFRPAAMIGTSYAITHVGKILNIPSINVNEDDFDIVPLYSKLSYPWASVIISPDVCKNGKWAKKTVKYRGYNELAYLHPNNFTPDKSIVKRYFDSERPYFLIRFAKLTAHHDKNMQGITAPIAEEVIKMLEPFGDIYITSEREMEPQFEKFRMAINPLDIHHVIAFAQLYIGDSQTMAAEAGVLGTPFLRYNDFVGRIGYLDDLENKFELGFGIKTNDENRLYSIIKDLLSTPNLKSEWQTRKQRMLSEKIDVSAFLTWFIENYPKSVGIMKNNPDYQDNFNN